MKTIYKGKDDLYYVFSISSTEDQNTPLSPSDLTELSVDFFTTGTTTLHFDKSDISPEGVLFVNADSLSTLPDGPLKIRIEIGLPDEGFDDDEFNQTAERLTGYFIKTLRTPVVPTP